MLRRPLAALIVLVLGCAHPTVQTRPTKSEAPVVPHALEAAIATPSPAPGTTPSPVVSPSGSHRKGDLITFEANRPGRTDNDAFLFNPKLDQVVELAAVNSEADEVGPYLTADNKLLIFQRTRNGHAEVMLLNLESKLINTLDGLNDETTDAISPSISNDGRWITFVRVEGERSRLRLYDVTTRSLYEVPGADRRFAEVADPGFSGDGSVVAFAARTRRPDGGLSDMDLYLYDVRSGVLVTPAFVNSPFDEDDPSLSNDGKKLAFDSNRFGTKDLFEADMVTHQLNNFAFLSTDTGDETVPIYFGPDGDWILYRLTPDPDNAPDDYVLRVYHPNDAQIDTLPVANKVLTGQ